MRKTKIVATIGPASQEAEVIKNMILSGVNVFRLNFSHGDHEYHLKNIKTVRSVSKDLNLPIAILQDLSGPKIRIGIVSTPFALHQGEYLEFYAEPIEATKKENVGKVYLEEPEILKDLKEGDLIYIADGLIKVKVVKVEKDKVVTQVIQGGVVSSRKGVNFPGVELSIPSFTAKDKKDLEFGVKYGVDLVALSFVKKAEDVLECESALKKLGGTQPVFAKIETQQAVKNIEEIIEVADGLMIARGDLGVELPIEKVPIVQKKLTKLARSKGKPVIIATQMLTSMINSISPTRADISDIANAVLDGADALMLSDETAVGRYPIEAVKMMARAIEEAETVYPYLSKPHKDIDHEFAIPHSSCILAEELGAKAIAVFTKTGSSAIRVSKFRPKAPILANVYDEEVWRRLAIVWGVEPFFIFDEKLPPEKMVKIFIEKAVEKGFLVRKEDIIVLTMGYPVAKPGSTNLIRVIKKEQLPETN